VATSVLVWPRPAGSERGQALSAWPTNPTPCDPNSPTVRNSRGGSQPQTPCPIRDLLPTPSSPAPPPHLWIAGGPPVDCTPESGAPRASTPSPDPRTRHRTPGGNATPTTPGLAAGCGFPSTKRPWLGSLRRRHRSPSSKGRTVNPSGAQNSFIPSPLWRYRAMMPFHSAALRCTWPFAKDS
jgi:hypothetical protein